mmetsp:Transcript_5037/g.10930  ORF Transcript_5037/g.10930 Transcript_5037/m.10930 type:complete len:81 (+) Transcript_5037:257-499(+)
MYVHTLCRPEGRQGIYHLMQHALNSATCFNQAPHEGGLNMLHNQHCTHLAHTSGRPPAKAGRRLSAPPSRLKLQLAQGSQ